MVARITFEEQNFINNVKHVIQDNDVMAVVKNDAYHFGLEFAVESFMKAGIRTFSTTSLYEAVRIRKIDPHVNIFLMNPSIEFEKLKQYDIAMTLPSLKFYHEHLESLSGIKLHLEFENLLHRSGLKDQYEMIQVLEHNASLSKDNQSLIEGIWTHFGYADEFDGNEYEIERDAWKKCLMHVLNEGYTFEFIHSQNSASFVREDRLLDQHTHARLGIILYGSRPYSTLPTTVTKQNFSVTANVIQVRPIKKGETCGYSFQFTAEKDCNIAVVDIGYGDGILKTRAKHDALINQKRYPIRGLMMSHMFVEVDESVQSGDTVTMYSDKIRIDEFTFKGVGANSEQISALNHHSLIKEIIS
ncbi:alanine racemase [Mammaliicoccus fleurettii]|uniref:alanine racemase n=1 Tax=Mammaliicoccus fleurettii TaxID=150056 RepID=UPI0009922AF8|nr:alanine racemase [Mammaliicoccus fleurettii]MEB7723244.1 alanine racemase [Mammaliicoccus fleurettii]OOV75984.1 alanine racemase [Mammaliicoccus fleurettii]